MRSLSPNLGCQISVMMNNVRVMPSFSTPILDAHLPEQIAKAAALIQQGKLVAFPTETVYGLGALGLEEDCIRKIFAAKNRPAHNPLILHVSSIASVMPLVDFDRCPNPKQASAYFDMLSQQFWPGPLTLVCKKSADVPSIATAGLDKVAVRVPNHPIAMALLNEIKAPVAAPSANASGRPSATCSQHVLRTLNGKIDAILDGGPCAFGLESTVVDISQSPPVILRTGAISLQQLQVVIPNIICQNIGSASHDSQGSPGRLSKHYSPSITDMRIANMTEIACYWHSSAALLVRSSTAKYLESSLGQRQKNAGKVEILADDALHFAKDLYASLYRLEQNETKQLVIEEMPTSADLWLTISDRLLRAIAKENHAGSC